MYPIRYRIADFRWRSIQNECQFRVNKASSFSRISFAINDKLRNDGRGPSVFPSLSGTLEDEGE